MIALGRQVFEVATPKGPRQRVVCSLGTLAPGPKAEWLGTAIDLSPFGLKLRSDAPLGEGLHVYAGPVPGFDGVAAAWRPHAALADGDGSYRALLLPLGPYRVKAELTGFKTLERTGISLSAGQTAVINFTLEVGGVAEVVSVSGEAPIAEPGKIDLGRTISESEVKNLPLVSRNPYNFAFLQANVTGYENEEFGVPRINGNGTQMHTNYQIDGNTITSVPIQNPGTASIRMENERVT